MKKNSGWLRILIVLSILYLVISIPTAMLKVNDTNNFFFNIYWRECMPQSEEVNSVKSSCWDMAFAKSQENKYEQWGESILFFSLIPLLLAWIFVFITRFTFRWIRAGFE